MKQFNFRDSLLRETNHQEVWNATWKKWVKTDAWLNAVNMENSVWTKLVEIEIKENKIIFKRSGESLQEIITDDR